MAGESAWTEAERHRRTAERYERGAQGEEATAAALGELPADSWTVIHDVAWPGRKLANIDHVVVGPPGVFVIDSKNWSGRITVDHDVLRQNGRARVPTMRSATAAAASVAGLVPEVRRDHVHAVLCFCGSEAPSAAIDDVLVCSTSTLVALLTSGATVMSDETVRMVADHLRSRLPAATGPRPAPVDKLTLGDRITMATPRGPAPTRIRRPSGLARSVVGLAAMLALAIAVNTGAFTAVTNGLTGLLVDQMAPPEDEPTQPPEKKSPEKKKANRDRQQQR